MSIATGLGYDCHQLVEGRPLIIGGVAIPHTHGLLGHSDADVLTHAIIDALLGAPALGDIGEHFPDTDERYRGADSIALLRAAVALLDERDCVIEHVDATVVIEQPKLLPYRDGDACSTDRGARVTRRPTQPQGHAWRGHGLRGPARGSGGARDRHVTKPDR